MLGVDDLHGPSLGCIAATASLRVMSLARLEI